MTRPTGERSGYRPTGYKMIESAEIRNFRGFQNIKLESCRRINLLIGENGAGKTSLLEALFLAAVGSLEIAFRLRTFRGYEGGSGGVTEIEDALWKDLFYNFNKNNEIRIVLLGSEYRNRSLTVKYADQNASSQRLSKKIKDDTVVEQTTPITFHWMGPKGRQITVKPSIKDGKIQIPVGQPLPEETFFFSAGHTYSATETAKRFSSLSRLSKERQIIEQFRAHFPQVEDLTIELIAGMPMVCAKVDGLPEKVPLNLISGGMSKLAAILFAAASQNGSVLLIDEIENGIYYKKFPVMWKSLLEIAKDTESQIFVTSHSSECLNALSKIASDNPDEISVIHVGKKGKIRQFGGDSFSNAIEADIEIR